MASSSSIHNPGFHIGYKKDVWLPRTGRVCPIEWPLDAVSPTLILGPPTSRLHTQTTRNTGATAPRKCAPWPRRPTMWTHAAPCLRLPRNMTSSRGALRNAQTEHGPRNNSSNRSRRKSRQPIEPYPRAIYFRRGKTAGGGIIDAVGSREWFPKWSRVGHHRNRSAGRSRQRPIRRHCTAPR